MDRDRPRPCFLDARVPELCASALPFCQRRLCPPPFRNHLAFMLGNNGKYVNGKARGLRHIAADEVDGALHQVGNERHITRQPIKAGNGKYGAAATAFFLRRGQMRPIGDAPAALGVRELRHQVAVGREPGDGLPLGVEFEPTCTLAVGGNLMIGEERSSHNRQTNQRLYVLYRTTGTFVQNLNAGFALYGAVVDCEGTEIARLNAIGSSPED